MTNLKLVRQKRCLRRDFFAATGRSYKDSRIHP
jgi:hypothetical protein